jgi:localization factor PodJL
MKPGGPWNFRGLRPRAREAALDAARQSGMSVGEWLNSVVERDDDDDEMDGRQRHQHRRESAGIGAPHRRHGGPYRDRHDNERHAPRREAQDEDDRERHPRRDPDIVRQRGHTGRDERREPREAAQRSNEFDQVNDRLDKLSQQLERHRNERDSAQRRDEFDQVNERLDKLSQQFERMVRADAVRLEAPAASNAPSEPREPALNTAPLGRAEAALQEEETAANAPSEPHAPPLNSAPPPPACTEAVQRETPAAANTPSEPLKPALRAVAPPRRRADPELALSIDEAVAEIAARQRVLDGEETLAERAPAAPPVAEPTPTVDFSSLESQLREITKRIEALKPSSDVSDAIGALRGDLAEISRQLNEALPRRAVESLESEIKALGERIDHSRLTGVDPNALAGLERGLAEVREALRGLTPAESLAGFHEAVSALSQKVDMILARDDPAALQQLEAAIGGLRGVVSHVASNDTLTRVAEDVRALAALVDGIANNATSGHALSALEQRIDTLAAALHASSEASQAVPRDLEKLLAGLIEKFEWVQLTHTDHAALAHLEDRIAMLVKRFDTSEARLNQLEAVERGLADLLVHVEQMRDFDADSARTARLAPAPASPIEHDVAEVKQSDRRAEDSLQAVHNPAEHVDHLAAIESNLYDTAPPPGGHAAAETPTFYEAPLAPQGAALDEIIPAALAAPPVTIEMAPAIVPLAPQPPAAPPAVRAPIDPTLPPDHPLEPGSAGTRSRPSASAAERVAASEAAIASTKPPVIADAERPNFIAAARRAAQAAAWEPPGAKAKAEPSGADQKAGPSKLSQRLRKLVVAGSALLIVVGCLRIAIRLFDDHHTIGSPAPVQSEQAAAPAAPAAAPIAQQATPASGPAAAAPPLQLPNPNDAAAPSPEPAPAPAKTVKPPHQSLLQDNERAATAGATKTDGGQPAANILPLWATPDITGTLPRAAAAAENQRAPAPAAAAAAIDDKLPAAIGDPALRAAALGGDPAAAYEVAARFAEGRGVPQNQVEAAHWLERAAKQGLAPAQFRLGGLYEKGTGVKKDLSRARDLYLAAAEKGNGKAMHNLAVLYAEGIDGAPDYTNAAEWFRKAADHGLRDSQYNLGILYARGIGVSQNYADSYKWFALAANQGDHDAASKRDDVASHLDAQSLAAARLAVQNFAPAPQPDDAINVVTATAWQSAAKPQHPAKAK